MNKVFKKIVVIVTSICGAIAAAANIIFVAITQHKIKSLEKEKLDREKADAQLQLHIYEKRLEDQKKNEEIKNKIINNDSSASDTAINELLRKSAESGKKRNNSST